jgi:hypothetical protein
MNRWKIAALEPPLRKHGQVRIPVQPSPPLKSPLPSSTNPDNYIVNSGADRIIITFPSLV